MSGTTVIHIRDASPSDPRIGRPSVFGNPFHIGMHGSREDVIAQFRAYIVSDNPAAIEARRLLPGLRGKRLVCYCAPLPCHGDVLVEMLQEKPCATDS